MEERKNGQGIFLGVVGVATLVVAIIGATFAYFSASANDATTINGNTAAAGGLDLIVTELVGDGTGLIPLNIVDGTSQLASALSSAKGVCVDDNGSNVCAIYKVAITNTSATNAIGINGKLNLASTGENMKWALLTHDDTDVTTVDTSSFTAIGTVVNQAADGYIAATATTNITLEANDTNYYYILVWLEETGSAQEGADASKSYTGTVTFNAVSATGATSGITATFNS